jgi:class 3 adenylate cyclase
MDSLSVKRRLTCILAADAVGYSRQMANDEEGTIRVLAAHRSVIDGIIAFHQGRIIGTAGDSVLAEFASAVEAVRSAIEIQDAIRTRNDSLPEDRRMVFRVGVNLGDVVVKDDDIRGRWRVNVAGAPRVEIAEPGGYLHLVPRLRSSHRQTRAWAFRTSGSKRSRTFRVPSASTGLRGTAPPRTGRRRLRATNLRRRSNAGVAALALGIVGLVVWQAGVAPKRCFRRHTSRDDITLLTAARASAAAQNADVDMKRAQAEPTRHHPR